MHLLSTAIGIIFILGGLFFFVFSNKRFIYQIKSNISRFHE